MVEVGGGLARDRSGEGNKCARAPVRVGAGQGRGSFGT